MIQRILRTALLAGAAVLLPSCIEADVETEVKADGTGSFGVSMKFSEKFVAIARKIEKLDPDQETVSEMKDLLFEKPDAETLARLEKAGLTLQEFESVNDEKSIGAKVRVGFKSLAALRDFDSMVEKKEGRKSKGSSPADDMRLVRNEDGTYTLSLGMKDGPGGGDDEDADDAEDDDGAGDDDGDDEDGEDEEGDDGEDGDAGKAPKKEPTPEEAAKKMQELMPLLGELMGEAQNLRISICMKVPGEVVEFAPSTFAKKEDGKVTWTLDFQSMMAAAMGGESNPMENFTVRFRMPSGTSIPDAALWAGEAAPEPARTATPPAKEGEPAGEGK